MSQEGSVVPHRPCAPAPHRSPKAAGTTPAPFAPVSRHLTMSNLNKDTEHTNGSGNVEEEVRTEDEPWRGWSDGASGWRTWGRARRHRGIEDEAPGMRHRGVGELGPEHSAVLGEPRTRRRSCSPGSLGCKEGMLGLPRAGVQSVGAWGWSSSLGWRPWAIPGRQQGLGAPSSALCPCTPPGAEDWKVPAPSSLCPWAKYSVPKSLWLEGTRLWHPGTALPMWVHLDHGGGDLA